MAKLITQRKRNKQTNCTKRSLSTACWQRLTTREQTANCFQDGCGRSLSSCTSICPGCQNCPCPITHTDRVCIFFGKKKKKDMVGWQFSVGVKIQHVRAVLSEMTFRGDALKCFKYVMLSEAGRDRCRPPAACPSDLRARHTCSRQLSIARFRGKLFFMVL